MCVCVSICLCRESAFQHSAPCVQACRSDTVFMTREAYSCRVRRSLRSQPETTGGILILVSFDKLCFQSETVTVV